MNENIVDKVALLLCVKGDIPHIRTDRRVMAVVVPLVACAVNTGPDSGSGNRGVNKNVGVSVVRACDEICRVELESNEASVTGNRRNTATRVTLIACTVDADTGRAR